VNQLERLDIIYKLIISILGSSFSFLFGGWSLLLQILIGFVIIDYVTGIITAGMKGDLSSYEGLRRIPKKILIFLIVAVGHLIDLMMGGTSNYVRDVVIFFYIVNELISIIENTGSAGLPIPPIIKKTVKLFKEKKDNS
jgi:toxin secretion/phage lysis holin